MGILAVNVASFAEPGAAAYAPTFSEGRASTLDEWAYLSRLIIFEGKMRGLFAMLFGASLLLYLKRKEASGADGMVLQMRRLFWLALFGLLHFNPPAFLAIGVLALLLGITMWAQFKLNPAAPDPVQQQVFSIMPWMMMFVMAPFAAGLLIYWITSNILTIAQQKYLYSKHPQMKAMVDKERADVAAASKAKK